MPRSTRPVNEWTIMCFSASDNELSLFNVSQLKQLKEAGFQKDIAVLAYADSNENGVPTRLFNMNSKLRQSWPYTSIGDGRNPYVRNFVEDEIPMSEFADKKSLYTKKLAAGLKEPDSMNASQALENFIGYCLECHPAKHYLLFCMGHGLIVGNDSFLYDQNPGTGISLNELGKIIEGFKRNIKKHEGVLELICLHSCSMSAVEVAYELQGTAKYMIASEGYSYVGSWPYRQLLKKIFNTTDGHEINDACVQDLVQRIYELSLYNATDFAYCGYSHDLTLCSLAPDKVDGLVNVLKPLIRELKQALKDPRGKELILLAHLKSQSFWREEYTDIYDFCRCLKEYCDRGNELPSLASSCQAVMDVLEQQTNPFDGLVVFTDNFGWESQYAHGLSIYFPWSPPMAQGRLNPLENYGQYAFNKDQSDNSWFCFLKEYWEATKRELESSKRSQYFTPPSDAPIFGSLDKPGGRVDKPGGRVADSPCICPSIKNFPFVMKLNRTVRQRSMSKGVKKVKDEKPTRRSYAEEE